MENEIGVVELKHRIEALPRDGRGRRRFGLELRRLIVGYAKRRMNQGATQTVVGRELGIHAATFSGWLQDTGGKKQSRTKRVPSKLRPVEVEAPVLAADLELRVVLPSGVELRGLGLDDLLAVAKALS